VTPLVTAAGAHCASFSQLRGAHGLRIDWVALLEDGAEIARDAHTGLTGGHSRNPVYVLKVPVAKPGARYTLRAQVAGDGGTDSMGVVDWELVPPLV